VLSAAMKMTPMIAASSHAKAFVTETIIDAVNIFVPRSGLS
jgi:hypothetical protein